MSEQGASSYAIDKDEVERIVEGMKKKYRDDGMHFEEVSDNLKELRGIIAEESYSKIDIESESDVENFDSKTMQFFGNFYLKTKNFLKPIQNSLKKLPSNKELSYYLYSADMHYSSNQYVAISSAVGLLIGLITFAIIILLSAILLNPLILIIAVPMAVVTGFIAMMITLFIPKQNAIARGEACSTELPFALRHMATELKAGIGLYKTIQAIAVADYGVLSEEFARTINEIEEGTDTSLALRHLALRTQSRPLKMAMMHIIRAMRIGGNLSGIINEIANDVSDDLKNRINSFSQKMNLFSVIFIFLGIVIPVGITILGVIRNSPITSGSQEMFKAIPLTPPVMLIFYFVVMPMLFIMMNLMIYSIQPKM
ncbi:MAG: type II secretion system F family protein [Candidatus Diapherotrites archaeon]|nr:type II secretion system F family protein [Candidatus Diapherotrites archaeon]